MQDHDCDCVKRTAEQGTAEQVSRREGVRDRWLTASAVLDAELPDDVASTLGTFLGVASVDTLGEWVDEVRHQTGGGSIAVDDLCHAAEPTNHRGVVDGETYYFDCFYDAVVLSALTESSVEIHTESPDGTTVEATASGTDDLTVTPANAVFSFGVSESIDPPEARDPTHADVYAAVCPYVRAFPSKAAYENWAATVPAATVATPLAGATELAASLVE